MFSTYNILDQFGTAIVQDLRDRTPSASGKTRAEIVHEVAENYLQVLGPSYIEVFAKGRGPTRKSGSSGKSLREMIREWIDEVSIVPQSRNGKTPTKDQLSYMIANHIHKYGNKLYQQLNGGETDYFTGVITESRILALMEAFSAEGASFVESEVISYFKN